MVDDVLNNAKEKMKKTCAVYEREMQSVRAGRANPQVLDRITVDYYGTQTPLNQVGNVSVPEARLLVIAPWETKMIKPIEKAIQASDLGLNPSNDGKVIRLVFPELNEERRKDLTKVASRSAEEAKVAVRSIRRDAMEQIKKMKKNSEITEDDQRRPRRISRRLPIRPSRTWTRSTPPRKRKSWRSDPPPKGKASAAFVRKVRAFFFRKRKTPERENA